MVGGLGRGFGYGFIGFARFWRIFMDVYWIFNRELVRKFRICCLNELYLGFYRYMWLISVDFTKKW